MDDVPICLTALNAAVNLFAARTGGVITILAILAIAIVFLIFLSAFFSLTETAYTSSSRIKLRAMATNGNKGAASVLLRLENYDRLINTLLIGNNIANITATSLAGVLFAILITSSTTLSTFVATVTLTFAILIFGEVMPKSIAREHAETIAIAIHPILSFFYAILMPFSWLLSLWRFIYKPKKAEGITDDELITFVEEAESEGGIDSHESELIRSAIEFDDVELYDIMVPRVNVIAVEDDSSADEVAAEFIKHEFSRLPVYNETIDSIVGILHEKDFFRLLRAGENDFKQAIKPALCLSRNMKISAALREMQKAKAHMTVVVDEFGGTTGIVTMEDILEELVGEIYDEHDEEEILFSRIGDDTFVISGLESLEDMFENLSIKPEEEFESTTVGGWITEQAKRIPLAGESFRYKNAEFIVTKSTARRVVEVKALLLPVSNED